MSEIERLRALLVLAAPRPWEWLDSGGDPDEQDELQGSDGEMIASGFRDDLGCFLPDGDEAMTDGRLCAAAVNALPALLDVAEAARGMFPTGPGSEGDFWSAVNATGAALARLEGA